MEILIYLILGSILGVSVGNTNIRNKIAEEIRTIITQEHNVVEECPEKKRSYKATYKAPKSAGNPQATQPKQQSNTLCSECESPIEIIDKMPGFVYCDKCKKVVNPKKKVDATKS
jgi:hypothetical protein